jgi:uncharacterized membrane protein YwzB
MGPDRRLTRLLILILIMIVLVSVVSQFFAIYLPARVFTIL